MIDLGRIEATREHLLADTLEVAIAFGEHDTISMSDALSVLEQSPPAEEDLMNAEEEDIDDDGQPDDIGEPEKKTKNQSYVENAFRHLEYRQAVLGDLYPFEVKEEVVYPKSNLDSSQKLYLILLACSRTRTFKSTKGMKQRLADCFESVSLECLRDMMPPSGSVFMFGPNSKDRKDIFGSKLSDAMPALAARMGMDIAPGWKAPSGGSGDGKIDIVGIFNFNDSAKAFHVIVGQCASMEDEKNWQKKRQEADLNTKLGTFHFLTCPTPALFFPAFYRASDGDWINRDMVSGVLPIDRLRILKTICSRPDPLAVDDLFNEAGLELAI